MRVLAALLCLTACTSRTEPTLDIATTTSVQTSGLLADLLPKFREQSGITVRVHAAGSGRALQMLEDEVVDLVISHAPETEQTFLGRHSDWTYRKIAHNRFVVAGPGDDPAGLRGAADVLDAFSRIARTGAPFVSRGDESGTHERERSLWGAAGIAPDPARVIVSGRGMAQALRHADEARAYLLTDKATFGQLRSTRELAVVFEGDPRLANTYAVIHPRANAAAGAMASWLAAGAGRKAIAGFTIDGEPAFVPWPDDCLADRPDALPCK